MLGGGKKKARHRWDHLTYSDGIEGRMAIFRTSGFRVPSLESEGVPGFKVSEQLSRQLDGHRASLGLPLVGGGGGGGGGKQERTHTGCGVGC